MSRAKVAEIAAMSPADFAVYRSKRNQRSFWQTLTHKEWVAFCKKMGAWFTKEAADEWDDFVAANNKRKAKSDAAALAKRLAG